MHAARRNSFCVLPWIHLNLNPDGRVTLCCQSHHQLFDEHGNTLNAQTHSLPEIWNSSGLKDLRRRMAAGEQLPHCRACFNDEAFGRTSYRERSNELWLEHRPDGPALASTIAQSDDGSMPRHPAYVDVRLGNICNLKCTACKPLYSSQIERDPVHAPWIVDAPYTRLPNRFGNAGEWFEAPALVDEMISLAGNLAMIQLAGGEPTINKTQIAFLQELCAAGRARDIELTVVTNLIAVRPDIYALFAQFKALLVIVSADGCDGTSYVRYPGKWTTLVRNIARLRAVCPNARLRIDVVLQAVNALNVVELFAWADAQDIAAELWIGRGLDHYNDFRILPPSVRDELAARFDRYLARKDNRADASTRQNVESVLTEMAATDFSDAERRARIVGFMQFINDLDTSRRLSFKAIAPEVHAAATDYLGHWDTATRYAGLPAR